MRKIIILSILGLLGFSSVSGQNNLTLYNMKPIPQKFYANPANQSDAKIFIGVPGISSTYMDFGLTAFKLRDILDAIHTDANGKSTFLISDFTKGFKKKNFISVSNSVDLLSFGFKLKNNYFFVNASIVNNARFAAPGDFFQFITQGNGGSNLNRKFDFGFGLDMMSYGEIGLGYSRKLMNERLTVGGRLHLIKGIAVLTTNESTFNFTTDKQTFDYTLQSNIEINSANSFSDIDGFNPFDTLNSKINNPGDFTETVNSILGSSNRGMAIDLGVVYRPTKKITVSASIINLGKITWNTNTYNWKSKNPNASYVFNGLNPDNALAFKGEDFNAAMTEFTDTLKSTFDLDTNTNTFKTGLFAQFYLGGNYNLTKNHNAGILLHGSFYKKTIDPAITLSWNSKLTKIVGISATYSIANNSFVNAGLGLSLNLGPIQTYFVSDNLVGIIAHKHVNTINLRTGMNVTLGRGEKKLKKKKKSKS
ncbi:MAG: hypothetical protein ACI9JN_001813 [Bacteroidia bacterium]|jgi:hypothetical protein